MYRIEFVRRRPEKFIKKSSAQLKDQIEICLRKISKNPKSCESLHGKFRKLLKYPLTFKGVNYRIVFEIYEEEKLIGIIHIGTRENFYKELERTY